MGGRRPAPQVRLGDLRAGRVPARLRARSPRHVVLPVVGRLSRHEGHAPGRRALGTGHQGRQGRHDEAGSLGQGRRHATRRYARRPREVEGPARDRDRQGRRSGDRGRADRRSPVRTGRLREDREPQDCRLHGKRPAIRSERRHRELRAGEDRGGHRRREDRVRPRRDRRGDHLGPDRMLHVSQPARARGGGPLTSAAAEVPDDLAEGQRPESQRGAGADLPSVRSDQEGGVVRRGGLRTAERGGRRDSARGAGAY